MSLLRISLLLLLAPGASLWAQSAESTISLEGLLGEWADRESLTRYPSPEYRMVEIVHRASDPESERDSSFRVVHSAGRLEYVLFESAGPGAIVHLSCDGVPRGILRVQLDDDRPIFEATTVDWRSGAVEPFRAPFLAARDDGFDLDFPMPFARSARVTLEPDQPGSADSFSYRVAARQYAPSTPVASMSKNSLDSSRSAIDRARSGLLGEGDQSEAQPWNIRFPITLSRTRPTAEIQIPPGQGGLISELRIRASSLDPVVLRQTILTLHFDGKPTVRVPLAEFFAHGPGSTPFQSMMVENTPDGEFVSRWPMPFSNRARISIEGAGAVPVNPIEGDPNNADQTRKRKLLGGLFRKRGKRDASQAEGNAIPSEDHALVAPPDGIEIEGYAVVRPYQWSHRSMYLHATWMYQADTPTSSRRPGPTLNISGQGVYVGTVLTATNPVKEWWGLGGESVYLDGSDQPDWVGGGMAEYFAIVPASPGMSAGPIRGESSVSGPKSFGHHTLYRWRTLDPVAFRNRLKWAWEIKHENPLTTLSLGAVHYWYQDPWSSSPVSRVAEEMVTFPALPERVIPRIAGAIEAESLLPLQFDGEPPRRESRQHLEDAGPWSGDEHLTWYAQSPGHQLVLAFDAPAEGDYQVTAYFSKSFDYGMHLVSVNDRESAEPIDLFHPTPMRMPPVDLGFHRLHPSGNRLVVRAVSSSKVASPKKCGFGLDCLVITPAPRTPTAQMERPQSHAGG